MNNYGQLAQLQLPDDVQRLYQGDIWSSYLYSAGDALAGTTSKIFTTPQGQQGQGWGVMSKAETNSPEGGRIPTGLAFTVRYLAVEPYYTDTWEVVRADMRNIQSHLVIVWGFLNSFFDVAPVSLIGQAGGAFGSTADTGGAEGGAGGSRLLINNGAGQCFHYDLLPIVLPAGQSFQLVYDWGSLAATVDGGSNSSSLAIRSHLVGTITTAVAVG